MQEAEYANITLQAQTLACMQILPLHHSELPLRHHDLFITTLAPPFPPPMSPAYVCAKFP